MIFIKIMVDFKDTLNFQTLVSHSRWKSKPILRLDLRKLFLLTFHQ